jgi:aspartate kinase
MDSLAATGEQVSAALMALAIQEQGVPARSFLGHQIKIRTDGAFKRARIKVIEAETLHAALRAGEIAVVAGFQGVDAAGNTTTLGRGGSDTSAVAIAVAVGAEECEIYTDVPGVLTADPQVCPDAHIIDRIAHEEMLELASLGARVLQTRSVELAMKYGVPVRVRSSFDDGPGTLVVPDTNDLEARVVNGVAHDDNQTKISVVALADAPDLLARLFKPLADDQISVDLIVHSVADSGRMTVSFTLGKEDVDRAVASVRRVTTELGGTEVRVDPDVVKVSIVGLGMRSRAGVAQQMFAILSREHIPIHLAVSTEIKVSCVVPSRYCELAVRALHDGFGLSRRGADR